jgi:hypothetical protein
MELLSPDEAAAVFIQSGIGPPAGDSISSPELFGTSVSLMIFSLF